MKSSNLIADLPERWKTSVPAIRAVQVAFDVSEAVLEAIRKAAFHASLSTSDQVRVVLGLPIVRQAKRPRLTISLNSEDYQLLGKRFNLQPNDHLAIKERVMAELAEFAHASTEASGPAPGVSRKPPNIDHNNNKQTVKKVKK